MSVKEPIEMLGDRPCGGVHGLSVLHSGYSGGPQELREELEAENEGVQITSQIRWLRSAEVRASYRERQTRDSPLVVPVLGGVGLHPPLQEWGLASGPLVQGRRIRGEVMEHEIRERGFGEQYCHT